MENKNNTFTVRVLGGNISENAHLENQDEDGYYEDRYLGGGCEYGMEVHESISGPCSACVLAVLKNRILLLQFSLSYNVKRHKK
jgi:hypothetical protein